MVNFGPLAAEIVSLVWGTPANFNGFRILAVLLHVTLVVGVSQTLRRWTEGATYIRQGGHQVGHWPTFLVDNAIHLWYTDTRHTASMASMFDRPGVKPDCVAFDSCYAEAANRATTQEQIPCQVLMTTMILASSYYKQNTCPYIVIWLCSPSSLQVLCQWTTLHQRVHEEPD